MESNEQELMELVLQLEALMRHEMIYRYHKNRSSSFNPHRGQGRIMSLLKMQPQISQKDLSFLLNMSKQALAELLGKLEAAGYITRTPSEEDRRVMIIRLTEAGQAAADAMAKQEKESDSIFSCLTADEQNTLRGYLKRMIEKSEKEMPENWRRHCKNSHRRFGQNNYWN